MDEKDLWRPRPGRLVAGSAASAAAVIASSVLGYFIDTRAKLLPDFLGILLSFSGLALIVPGLLALVRFAGMASELAQEAIGEIATGGRSAESLDLLRDRYSLGALYLTATVNMASRLLLPIPTQDLVTIAEATIVSVGLFVLTAKLALTRHSR
jgi:hypothetical protein